MSDNERQEGADVQEVPAAGVPAEIRAPDDNIPVRAGAGWWRLKRKGPRGQKWESCSVHKDGVKIERFSASEAQPTVTAIKVFWGSGEYKIYWCADDGTSMGSDAVMTIDDAKFPRRPAYCGAPLQSELKAEPRPMGSPTPHVEAPVKQAAPSAAVPAAPGAPPELGNIGALLEPLLSGSTNAQVLVPLVSSLLGFQLNLVQANREQEERRHERLRQEERERAEERQREHERQLERIRCENEAERRRAREDAAELQRQQTSFWTQQLKLLKQSHADDDGSIVEQLKELLEDMREGNVSKTTIDKLLEVAPTLIEGLMSRRDAPALPMANGAPPPVKTA